MKLNVIDKPSGDIIITIPRDTNWSTYEQELAKAEAGEIMNFKVHAFPKGCKVGDKCYLCYKDQVVGYMHVCGLSEEPFTCTTTGNDFEGKFIQRSGKFHKINPIPMKGFRGFRYAKGLI